MHAKGHPLLFFLTRSMDSTLLGLRGVGEGAEEEEPAVCKGNQHTALNYKPQSVVQFKANFDVIRTCI